MLETGIPVPRALEVAGRTAGLESFRQAASRAESVVRAGGRLAKGLESPLFPAAVLKMAAVGEASGNLSGMISEAAALMEMEVDALLGRLPPILETSMLLVVGGNVAFIMLSLFLPILSLYQSVQK
jgi:type II secretory pathway component PulF